jgi:hypothetical protein
MNLVREPDAVNPPVRFDEREVETKHGKASEAPADERAGNRKALPKPPRHLSTLPFSCPTAKKGFPAAALPSSLILDPAPAVQTTRPGPPRSASIFPRRCRKAAGGGSYSLTFAGGTLQATSNLTLPSTLAVVTPDDPALSAIIDRDGHSVTVVGGTLRRCPTPIWRRICSELRSTTLLAA